MQKLLYFSIVLLVSLSACQTVRIGGKKIKLSDHYTAKPTLQLQMPDGSGTNGAAVAYHTKAKQYWAVFAGNEAFPLGVYNEKGELLNKDKNLNAAFDVRGIWYNSFTKKIEGNAYFDAGVFSYNLDNQDFPNGITAIYEGQHQPDANSVGAYDSVHNELIYWNEGVVYRYNRETGAPNVNFKPDGFADSITFNISTVIYTYLPKQEIGLLDDTHGEIYLFDRETGKKTSIIRLPKDAPTQRAFNISYANGRIWLFDIESRTWKGYELGK